MKTKKLDPHSLNKAGKAKLKELNEKMSHLVATPDDETEIHNSFTPGLLQSLNGMGDNWELSKIKKQNGVTINVPCLLDANNKTCITIDSGSKGFNAYNKDVINGYVSAITSRLIDSPIWGQFVVEHRKYMALEKKIERQEKKIKSEKNESSRGELETEKTLLLADLEKLEQNIVGLMHTVNNSFVYDIKSYLKWSSNRKVEKGKNDIVAKKQDYEMFTGAIDTLLKSRFQKTQTLQKEETTKNGGKRRRKIEIVEAATNMFRPVDIIYTEQETAADGTVIKEREPKYIRAIRMDFDALRCFILSNIEVIQYPAALANLSRAHRTAAIYCMQMYKTNFMRSGSNKFPTINKILGILLTNEQRENMMQAHPGRVFDVLNEWISECKKYGLFTGVQMLTDKNADVYPTFNDITSSAKRRMLISNRNEIENARFVFELVREPFSENYKAAKRKLINHEQLSLFDNPAFLN